MITNEAVGLPIRPVGIHGGAERDINVRTPLVEGLVVAHETLELLAVDFRRDGLGLQDRHGSGGLGAWG